MSLDNECLLSTSLLKNKLLVIELADPSSSFELHGLIQQISSLLKEKGYLTLVVDFPENSLATQSFDTERIWEENLLVPYDFGYFYSCLALFYNYCNTIDKALKNQNSTQPVCILALRYIYRYNTHTHFCFAAN